MLKMMKEILKWEKFFALCNLTLKLCLFDCYLLRCDSAFMSDPKYIHGKIKFGYCDILPPMTYLSSTQNGDAESNHFHNKDMKSQWEVFDDWSSLSSEDKVLDSSSVFNRDVLSDAVKAIDNSLLQNQHNDLFLDDDVESLLDSIYMETFDPNQPALYDTVSDDNFDVSTFELDAENEISLLVRCNESPDELLISQGRALPPLTLQERYDYQQLVTIFSPDNDDKLTDANIEPTEFFRNAIFKMFQRHSILKSIDTNGEDLKMSVMDKKGVARWLSTSLREPTVTQFDKRVTKIISQYGVYKSAALTLENFEQIYYTSVKKELLVNSRGMSARSLKKKSSNKLSVWNDIENHGINPPIVQERLKLREEIEMKNKQTAHSNGKSNRQMYMDECEIIWGQNWNSKKRDDIDIAKDSYVNSQNAKSENSYATQRYRTQSHQLVKMAEDGRTPLRVRDGQFVFVDEESCIGCKQCVNVASSAFTMLESGRARCFEQSNSPEIETAIAACPVNCIHLATFNELKQLESARDNVDSLNEGFTKSKIPLHVARRDSDSNRKSSVYHHLKSKCYMSKECPKRGCYECPNYSKPGANPYFQKNHREAEHIRALEIMESGEGDIWRNFAEL